MTAEHHVGDATGIRPGGGGGEAAEARFWTAMREAPIGMAIVALDHRILEVNEALCRLVGRPADELVTLTTLEITHPEDRPLDIAYGRQLMADEGALNTIEKRFVRPDGSVVWGLLKTSVIRDVHGEPDHVIGQVVDITDRVNRESALERAASDQYVVNERLREITELKDTFIAGVSHEMLTPLTALEGFGELLRYRRHDLAAHDVEQLIARICHNTGRLTRLVSDLLELGHLTEGGVVAPEFGRTDLGNLIGAVLEHLPLGPRRVSSRLAQVELEVDAAKVERILTNLISNAVRHTPETSHVWVDLVADGTGAVLTVADDGPGIPDALKEELFTPFTKGDSTTAKATGAGIGLTLVAKFAALHGGRSWITDHDGGGAAVHVSFPGPTAPTPAR